MITASNISLSYGTQVLFKEVNIKFTPGNCYGIIGANGAGKSTFLKILSGEIEPDTGEIIITPGERMTTLRQDHFAFNKYRVIDTVIMGHKKLYSVMKERDEIYQKEDFTEEDGIRAAELESEFAEMGGWEAESEAAQMLDGLGIPTTLHEKLMEEIEDNLKVRVLLAQALFGNPDILLLDEPTNHLDLESIHWLEDFLADFNNTVIVVSHDRHFLNTVCTHVCDIDFGKIQLYVGNYDFWYMSSQLAAKQMKDEKKRREDKIAELKEFIQRFSSNVAKAKQATSRKKLIDKLTLDDIRPSSRRFPYVAFKPNREIGKNCLEIKDLSKTIEGEVILDKLNLTINPGEKVAFVGPNHYAKTVLFQILAGEMEPDSGSFNWGVTTSLSYFPKDNSKMFDTDQSIADFLQQYSTEDDDTFVRSFLGRMLFTGDEALKSCKVLSGGEKVRVVLAKMMLEGANCLIFDEPTSHLDLEAIQALNDGLINFNGVILFNSHDHQFVDSIANRIIEFTPNGIIDRMTNFDSYINDQSVNELRDKAYAGSHKVVMI
ncbi:MAG: ATP-binding cassette domain-containing protein [Spirochaetales bacterium]|uniref:ABC-F family ATP-binding cassette domain-containing protein n=1 Tax=Bullifex sp. TaxID=2815808 RepID=UPI002A4F210D|nr:ATP-binding cassette domain-containing protein [Bullifex sp.]MDD5972970.1 ATP-binding cassette domain-containing protein [Spirochaetales bacterium]MDD7271543.1 ATP-binding cassette domain-containing protein [Spirochaetales bacterium]MDY4067552.1 ATP-binding cassette domain-containing protein [Bullifex sp.]